MTTPEMPPVTETSLPNAPEKKVDWGFWVWMGCSLVLVLVVTVVGTAWAVRHTIFSGVRFSDEQQQAVLAVASLPGSMIDGFQELMWQFSDDPEPQLMDRAVTEKPYWVRHFPEPTDTGYLLFSGVDAKAKQSIVELIRISDGKSMARWVPDWGYILSNTEIPKGNSLPNIKTMRPVHPLLMINGDIVFNTGGSLIRMNLCSTKPIWQINNILHHSNQLDSNGNIVTGGRSDAEFPIKKWSGIKWRDDSIVTISPSGVIIQNTSIASILIQNNLTALIFGIGGELNINNDLIHVNEIRPALVKSDFWEVDDLLVSSRHLSTVFLYRPSTGKIIWHKTGPWMNQHSADFVNNHSISVFNNNVASRIPNDFIKSDDHNTVMVYDFLTGKTSEPFRDLLIKAQALAIYEGRATVLSDGGLFIEETHSGRHMRFIKDRLLWSRINYYSEKKLGRVSWSRYLTLKEAQGPLQAIQSNSCNNQTPN